MNHTLFRKILMIEAAACLLLYYAKVSFAGIFTAAAAFPFEQIGMGLRALSLVGWAGNAAAIVIYFIVSLLPAVALLFLRKRRKRETEDGLLILLSVVLFAVLYFMINPGLLPLMAARQPVGNAMLGGIVYSILCGYLVLRGLRLFTVGNIERLQRYMRVMLNLLSMIFVYLAFGVCFGELLDSIASLQAGNMGNEHILGMTYVFLILQFIVNALPYVLNLLVIFAALRLLEEMQKDRYSVETVAATEAMSRLCVKALTIIMLFNIGFNLLQLLFAGSLMVINSSLLIPVFSVLFVLAALLLTRFVAENKQLKDENEQFI